jgi:hypothetical protein
MRTTLALRFCQRQGRARVVMRNARTRCHIRHRPLQPPVTVDSPEQMMRRRWLRWMIRIGLGIVATLGVAVVALFIYNPSGTVLLTAIFLQPLLANTRPPPIAEDQLAGANWQNQGEASRKLNGLLQRRFPAGTSEVTLRSTLLNQGFKPPPPPRADCVPPGQPTPVGRVFTRCPTGDQSKILQYEWGSGVCGQTITVRWSTGNDLKITSLDAGYYMACL